MPVDLKHHPVFTESATERNAYLQKLADNLIKYIDEPDTFFAAAHALDSTGLGANNAAAIIGISANTFALILSGGKELNEMRRTDYIRTAIQLLSEQLPHPPEGF